MQIKIPEEHGRDKPAAMKNDNRPRQTLPAANYVCAFAPAQIAAFAVFLAPKGFQGKLYTIDLSLSGREF
jgi:hypothetical protein